MGSKIRKPSGNCLFINHQEYRIYCNIVDSSKNFVNGERSNLISTLIPKGIKYIDMAEYSSKEKVEINQYQYSEIKIEIKNHNDEDVVFDTPFSVKLLLE